MTKHLVYLATNRSVMQTLGTIGFKTPKPFFQTKLARVVYHLQK